MKHDLMKASRRLSELELKLTVENLTVDILWFRAMSNSGDWVIKRHTHSTYEFHFIASGSCKVVLDDSEAFEARAGEFYLTAPGVFHEQRGMGAEKLVEYSMNCDFSLLNDEPTEAQHILKVLQEAPRRQLKDVFGAIRLFDRALQEAYSQDLGFYNNIKSLAYMIIASAARAVQQNVQIKYEVPLKSKKDDHRILQIEKYIEDNLSSPISTKDLARHMYLSDKQVCRIINQQRGISTKGLIVSIKLQKAKDLLKSSSLSIKQISNNLGFSSEYYFNQFFKREEGYPPGVFRRNVQR